MATKQTFFNKFDKKIKISFDEDSKLREKRDMLLSNLRDSLRELANKQGIIIPKYEWFNQGSYDLRTGIKPLYNEDNDIDIGIIFNFLRREHSPTEVKKWIFEALQSGNRTVEYKRPCVRVQYHKNYQKAYHVDIAIYTKEESNWSGTKYYLSKGFVNGKDEEKIWEVAEPFKLKETLKNQYRSKESNEQFRRIIRFLKRWKDENFTAKGNARPTGIALTACGFKWFKAYDEDLDTLQNLVNNIIRNFSWSNRININLPVAPRNNLFEKMTDKQMLAFKNKLIRLNENLREAQKTEILNTFVSPLIDAFGNDFPTL